ncbi:hypothetical protein DSO57_1014913 [Entomophthora muscae]|uniref:Uncharacterized protein n=1 Tax=Entomophthora muscae TaxID=34485 RepID=A0ACC2T5E3_9FUNG|nr:hypothetical protein DSO57_1014913 [Entomophthora muscae]
MRLLENTNIQVSWAEFCKNSPQFCQDLQNAVLGTRPRRMFPSILAETGALCTSAMVDGHSMLVIIDSRSYANIIPKDFLDYIRNTDIKACDSQFMLADGCNTPCEGIVCEIELCIQGVSHKIEVVVFAHNQYNLLIGQKTLKDFMINTIYGNNYWTM